MALLSVKTRQKYLKELGYYTGEIDGKVGPLTKKAYRSLQNEYFERKKDRDGYYGPDTDTLLRNAYNFRDIEYFDLKKCKCKCKGLCTGYPVVIDRKFIVNVDDMRRHFGIPFNQTSVLRCKAHNKKVGGSSGSRHTKGKAMDFYCKKSATLAGRKELSNYWIKTYDNARYTYSDGYYANKSKSGYINKDSMGTSVHVDVK